MSIKFTHSVPVLLFRLCTLFVYICPLFLSVFVPLLSSCPAETKGFCSTALLSAIYIYGPRTAAELYKILTLEGQRNKIS